tara:strand:+ start:521 stop:682 length:162 start_codon:yes stop_codon:yes gene_type:complete
MLREKMIELQKKVFEIKGGAFALLPGVKVHISSDNWKEIDKLEKEIEKIRQQL